MFSLFNIGVYMVILGAAFMVVGWEGSGLIICGWVALVGDNIVDKIKDDF